MKSNTKIPKRLIAVIIILVLAAAALIALAWQQMSDNVQTPVTVSNFLVDGEIYFQNGATKVPADISGNGTVKVDLTHQNAVNYIGKLRYDIKYNGVSPAYVRVRILEQWVDSNDEIISIDVNTPYIIGNPYNMAAAGTDQSAWYDNRGNDFCLYYAQLLSKTSAGSYELVPVISGVSGSITEDPTAFMGISLYVSFLLEAVQPNRTEAFWNINQLPWRSAGS